jgi:hypothetical protein
MTPEDSPSPEELERRQQWFDWYVDRCDNHSVHAPRDGRRYTCPCCGYLTLEERGGYDICPVCFWEDDGQDDADADTVRCGPNQGLSLTEARHNFREFSASDRAASRTCGRPRKTRSRSPYHDLRSHGWERHVAT